MGLRLRFVDIDKDTLNIDVKQIEEAITPDTRMILAVNLLGNPNDFDALMSICEKRGIILAEDNCESMGAEYKGRLAGTFGLFGTFSTFYSHHLCTMEGGVVVTNDTELYHYMLSLRSHGWTRHLPADSPIYNKRDNAFYESFNFILPGYNLRPIEMEGALGTEQLKKLDAIIRQRRKNAAYFNGCMKKIPFCRTQRETEKSSWFGFAVVLEDSDPGLRDRIVSALNEAEIEVRPIVAGNFVRNPVIERLPHTVYGDLSAADDIHNNGFFVGNHGSDNTAETDYFIEVLSEALTTSSHSK
jgi:CDP-6-deoxy-D-xylo-4-hexulose-3-dehydrase